MKKYVSNNLLVNNNSIHIKSNMNKDTNIKSNLD